MFAQPLSPRKSSKSYIFWVCVCSLSYPALKAHTTYFSVICRLSNCTILLHVILKRHDFRNKFLNLERVFWFSLQLLSEIFLITRRIQLDIVINVQTPACKVPVILVRFSRNFNFLNIFSKNTQISNFTKIRTVGADLFHADERSDRRTDVTELIVAIRNSATAPKNW